MEEALKIALADGMPESPLQERCASPDVASSPNTAAVSPSSKYRLGICCRDKKQKSKPMKEFLQRIEASGHFEIVLFPEEVIQNQPPEQWPVVDCCIPFFSDGFPLDKAIIYANMHQDTFFLTEPREQLVMLDRRGIYHALVRNNIPVVRHIVCSRDGAEGAAAPVVEEHMNYIIVDGQRFDKPFVEKPVDAEDHNIRIYYRDNQGSRHLFRKVGDKSSAFHPDCNEIRKEGSYLYEEFVETSSAQDVKVYTVGSEYAHAECRKSPVVDGQVQRDENGKEVRSTTELTGLSLFVCGSFFFGGGVTDLLTSATVTAMQHQTCSHSLFFYPPRRV